ncbi:HNH endonuclease [Deinococcus navajonensis]|uniref:HNH endonuclease n=1 Tax=Deinococcus navajonensis TaxID=309884 RepID=A0ABV8XR72_9DEIO
MSAWSFLTLPDELRQFAGNNGYADDLTRHYSYDSTVQNYRKVAVGDQVVLRDDSFILGIGRVESIEVEDGRKERLRCPNCGNTGLKTRRKGPLYRCDRAGCRIEFDEPRREWLDVRVHRAVYRDSWQPLKLPVRVDALREIYADGAAQFAIRPLKVDELDRLITSWRMVRPSQEVSAQALLGGHLLALVRQRRGQGTFRRLLLERFGSSCAILGPQPAQALEAAHLYVYAHQAVHDPRGGLLLRRDLHALFDAGLLCVDPDIWQVRVSPTLNLYPDFASLNGRDLSFSADLRPRPEYLAAHFAEARRIGQW